MKNQSIAIYLLIAFFVLSTQIQAQWEQVGQTIFGDHNLDQSGYSVSISSNGNVLATGAILNDSNGVASGQTRIYHYTNGEWVKAGQDIYGEENDESGYSISLNSDGSIIAIGSPKNNTGGHIAGCVRIYQFINGSWAQIGEDILGNEGDNLGYSVNLNGNGTLLAIGAPYAKITYQNTGYVSIYHFVDGEWKPFGQKINGTDQGDLFGFSVSLSLNDSIVAIGTQTGNNKYGYTRIYSYTNGNWSQMGQDIIGNIKGDRFGSAVSINSNGTLVAIGAQRNSENGSDAGQVRVYQFINDSWSQIGEAINGETDDWSGYSVSLSAEGLTVAIGSPWNNDAGLYAGKIRIYHYDNESWTQIGNSILGIAPDYNIGYSLALNADGFTLATGAPGTGKGYTKVYKNCQSSSALNIVACNSYTVPSGNETYSVSGIYYDTIPNAAGCDSILTINLTVNNIDTSVINEDPTLTAVSDNALYQWLDCNNNFEKIEGETGQSFHASKNGNYAVEISKDGCTDTSSCFTILKAAILLNKVDPFVTVFPTVADNFINIKCLKGSIDKVTIYDMLGRSVFSKSEINHSKILDISDFKHGTYFIQVFVNNKRYIHKFIKK